ncbi:MAG: hypothetical protein ACK5VF_01565, partial [Bacteroidota bacterium]
VFGLWQLVFGSIFSRGMNIPPKTKDHTLKTGKVIVLWHLLYMETGISTYSINRKPEYFTQKIARDV